MSYNIDCFYTEKEQSTKVMENFQRIWKKVRLLLLSFALPVVQVIVYFFAIGRDPANLHLAIANREMNWTTKSCPVFSNCSFRWLSCRYIDTIKNDTIIKDYYATPEEAVNAVKSGDAWGALYFTENFTEALFARMVLGKESDDETLDQSEMRLWMDLTNLQIGLMLNKDLIVAYREFVQSLLKACGQNPKLADIPIQFNEPIYGGDFTSFSKFIAPGVILLIVFSLAMGLTSSSVIIERVEGSLDRQRAAGVTPLEILSSHIFTQLIVVFGQSALSLIFMIVVFDVECRGSILLVIILTLLQGLCGMCFGFVISAVCEHEKHAIQLALGSFCPNLLLSGILWPIEGMPLFLRYISTCLPLTLATSSLRSILSRGHSIDQPDTFMGFVSTITWIILFLCVSFSVLKFKQA